MTNLFSWLPAEGWARLMTDALWQSAIVAALGLLASRFLLRQPAARAWVLLLSLGACFLVPIASLAARNAGVALLPGRHDKVVLAAATPVSVPTVLLEKPRAIVSSIEIPRIALAAIPKAPVDWMQALAVVWLAASVVLIVRLMLSYFAVRRLLRRATICEDAALLSAAANAAKRVGMSAAPALLISHGIQTPMVLAIGQPRLLIPPRANCNEEEVDWTAAFSHELAHVVRSDGWARLGMELVTIALPLQPLIWLMRRSFHIASEEACDDWAVASGSDPTSLANTLLNWLGCNPPVSAAGAIGMSSTKLRVLRLLALRETPAVRLPRRWRWASVLIMLVLGTAVAIAQTPKPQKSDTRKATPAPSTDSTAKDTKRRKSITITADEQGQLHISSDETEITAKSLEVNPPPEVTEDDIKRPHAKFLDFPPSADATTKKAARIRLPEYVIEPPDILLIELVRGVPKQTTRVAPFDKVKINVLGTLVGHDIRGTFTVNSAGEVSLGAAYGRVKLEGLTRAEAESAVEKHLRRRLQEPEIEFEIDESRLQTITGEHLVGPDGYVNLGIYGKANVAGLKLADAKKAIETQLGEFYREPLVSIDIIAYNSKVYYVISQGSGSGDSVTKMPITGNETVLDAIAQIGSVPGLAKRRIWIARPHENSNRDQILPVSWNEIISGGSNATNYQILPGDRLFIAQDEVIAHDEKDDSEKPGVEY